MNGFAADLFQILRPGFDDQIGSGDRRKTIGSAGTAKQTIKKRLFDFLIPFQASLDNGPQKGQTSTGNPRLVPGGSEYRACHLTEPATVAMRYLVVMFGDGFSHDHQLSTKIIGSATVPTSNRRARTSASSVEPWPALHNLNHHKVFIYPSTLTTGHLKLIFTEVMGKICNTPVLHCSITPIFTFYTFPGSRPGAKICCGSSAALMRCITFHSGRSKPKTS